MLSYIQVVTSCGVQPFSHLTHLYVTYKLLFTDTERLMLWLASTADCIV